MKDKRISFFAWIIFGLITALVIAAVIYDSANQPDGDRFGLEKLLIPFVPVTFTFVGALIISRQPRNVIGLLMMLPGLSLFIVVDAYLRSYSSGLLPLPESPSLLIYVIFWFSNWNWLLIIFPILFILVLFPSGRPSTPRWGWLIYFGLFLCVMLIGLGTFAQYWTPSGADLGAVRNPIGFISVEWFDTYFIGPWFFSLPLLTLMCAASLFFRFRQARGVEREQIKWLFYAGVIFALFYVPSFAEDIFTNAGNTESAWNVLWIIGMLAIPAAIAIAILRYRLYDIDIIIRRTLVYTILTATLALVYFGLVILLEGMLRLLVGSSGQVATVISTLAIAALFTPLRRRLQDTIDRRFYRSKYNAEQALAEFAATARAGTDLEALTARMLRIVEKTIQPQQVSVWLRNNGSLAGVHADGSPFQSRLGVEEEISTE